LRLPVPNIKGMSQLPETQVSTVALGPASLPGPGSDFVPAPAASSPVENSSSSDSTGASPVNYSAFAHDSEPPPPQRIPGWLVRIELLLRVMLRMYIGLAICYAPWSHVFWDQNPIFLQFPSVGMIAVNGAVRGLVSGLGLLNLWIAFQDALRRGRD